MANQNLNINDRVESPEYAQHLENLKDLRKYLKPCWNTYHALDAKAQQKWLKKDPLLRKTLKFCGKVGLNHNDN